MSNIFLKVLRCFFPWAKQARFSCITTKYSALFHKGALPLVAETTVGAKVLGAAKGRRFGAVQAGQPDAGRAANGDEEDLGAELLLKAVRAVGSLAESEAGR